MDMGARVASENARIPWKEKKKKKVKSSFKTTSENFNLVQIFLYLQFFEAKCYFSVNSNLKEVKLSWTHKHLTVYRSVQICLIV